MVGNDQDVLFGHMLGTRLLEGRDITSAAKVLSRLQGTTVINPVIKMQREALKIQLERGSVEALSSITDWAENESAVSRLANIMLLIETNAMESALQETQACVPAIT